MGNRCIMPSFFQKVVGSKTTMVLFAMELSSLVGFFKMLTISN